MNTRTTDIYTIEVEGLSHLSEKDKHHIEEILIKEADIAYQRGYEAGRMLSIGEWLSNDNPDD